MHRTAYYDMIASKTKKRKNIFTVVIYCIHTRAYLHTHTHTGIHTHTHTHTQTHTHTAKDTAHQVRFNI